MEHRRMGGVGIDPVGLARGNHLQRRFVHPGIAHLHRAGVGTQHQGFRRGIRRYAAGTFDVERIGHRACRMVGGNVQRGEVEMIFLDLWAVGHIETDGTKDPSI